MSERGEQLCRQMADHKNNRESTEAGPHHGCPVVRYGMTRRRLFIIYLDAGMLAASNVGQRLTVVITESSTVVTAA